MAAEAAPSEVATVAEGAPSAAGAVGVVEAAAGEVEEVVGVGSRSFPQPSPAW